MKAGSAQKISNMILSGLAGLASFVFSLAALLFITELDEKIVAALVAGTFCLLISYIASERPNSQSARALAALAERLLAVERGDFTSPVPALVRRTLPKVAAAAESLFAKVRSSIDSAHALGMFDSVTSLPNRLHFRSEVNKMLAAAAPDARSAMLFIDLDRFKSVNDRLGHARGDQLLLMVANRLRVIATAEQAERGGVRPLLARLAGDEFTLFFADIASADDIERVARRIAATLAEPFEVASHAIDIGASVGVAIAGHGATVESLMRSADIAMYRAKSSGGSRHWLFDERLAAEHRSRGETEQALRQALERGELVLAFQPQLSLAGGQVVAAEALLRWNHPRDGLRLPASFLPVAEQSGIIADIGEWMIGEVARLLGAWQAAGWVTPIAFHISPRQLERGDFWPRLRQAFERHGAPLPLAEFQFSETMAMRWGEQDLAEIAALRRDGARIAIDDFGSGHSSLTRLRALPLDRLRLDPALIADIVADEQARTLVQAVIQLSKGIGAEIVAPAVAGADQAALLKAMGCDAVQGPAVAAPMAQDALRQWIARPIRQVA